MIKEAILSYFQEQLTVVVDNWQTAQAEHDVDALHDLRVGIKRLKALYQVLDPMSNGVFEYKLHFEDIRQLFKAVGKLRDIQVQSRLFAYFAKEAPLENFKDFYWQLQSLSDAESEDLKVALLHFNPKVAEDSLNDAAMFLDAYPEDKAIKLTLKYLKKRLNQIAALLPQKKDEEAMHEMRSRVKQAFYCIELLKLMQPDLEPIDSPKTIKLVGELLGQWHDHVVLAAQIELFLEENDDEFPAAPYENMLKSIRKAAKKLLKEARKKLKKHPLF
jgi:CHAD domain-containing protein